MSSPASRPRAVLFDFFGTLTRAVRRGAGHQVMSRRLGVDPDAFAAALDATFYRRATGEYGSPPEALRRVLGAMGVRADDAAVGDVVAARIEAARVAASLRPDAVAVLA